MNSRRTFLKSLSGVTLASAAASSLPRWALASPQTDSLALSGEDDMIVRSARFFDLETPVEFLNTWLTPVPHFFVRNHMHEPSELTAETWRLTVGGEVEKPLTLTLHDLAKLESHSVVNTLECAGNGRSLHRPQVPGIQWGKGAVSTARFTGPRLRDVLQQAGIKASGKHVMFRGLDEVPGKVPPFIRSIPIEKALDSDTLDRHPNEWRASHQASWLPCPRAGSRMDWRRILQMAHRNQDPRFRVCRELHESRLPLPQSASQAGRLREARRHARRHRIECEVGDLRTARRSEREIRQVERAWRGMGRRSRYRQGRDLDRRRLLMESRHSWETRSPVTPGGSGRIHGPPKRETTRFNLARPTVRAACNRPNPFGTRAVISITQSTR